jgi:hypothetical protein
MIHKNSRLKIYDPSVNCFGPPAIVSFFALSNFDMGQHLPIPYRDKGFNQIKHHGRTFSI